MFKYCTFFREIRNCFLILSRILVYQPNHAVCRYRAMPPFSLARLSLCLVVLGLECNVRTIAIRLCVGVLAAAQLRLDL